MKTRLLLCLMASLLFIACDEEHSETIQVDKEQILETVLPNDNISNYKISPQEAIDNLMQFLDALGSSNLSKSSRNYNISSVSAFRKNNSLSKNYLAANDIDIDTMLYSINFADSAGFAIVSADKRADPIYAIVDEGNFDFQDVDNIQNPGFGLFLENTIDLQFESINNYSKKPIPLSKASSKKWTITEYKAPLLQTKWGQGIPYNYYCPYYPDGHTGCVVIAVAQILSYYQTINRVSWQYNNFYSSAQLNWSQILKDCNANNGILDMTSAYSSSIQVANFCRYFGIACDADYKVKSTSVSDKRAIQVMNDFLYLNASSMKSYNENDIISAIAKNKIVYAGGYRNKKKVMFIRVGYTDGHAWVCDGYLKAKCNNENSIMLHCNWGWDGTANGYYLSNSFNVSAGPELDDSNINVYSKSTTEDYNYKYKLEYSIITLK